MLPAAGLLQLQATVDRSQFVPMSAYPSWQFVPQPMNNMGELDEALDKASQEIQAVLDQDEAAIRLKTGTVLD